MDFFLRLAKHGETIARMHRIDEGMEAMRKAGAEARAYADSVAAMLDAAHLAVTVAVESVGVAMAATKEAEALVAKAESMRLAVYRHRDAINEEAQAIDGMAAEEAKRTGEV